MGICQALREIHERVSTKDLSQADVAREAQIQRTQYNTYLRKNGTLPIKSLTRTVRVVLVRINKLKEKGKYREELSEFVQTLEEYLSRQESGILPMKSIIASAICELKTKNEGRRIKREDLGKLWPCLESILEVKVPPPKWYEDSIAVQITGTEGSVADIKWSIEKGLSMVVGRGALGPILYVLVKQIPGVIWSLRLSDTSSRMELKEEF